MSAPTCSKGGTMPRPDAVKLHRGWPGHPALQTTQYKPPKPLQSHCPPHHAIPFGATSGKLRSPSINYPQRTLRVPSTRSQDMRSARKQHSVTVTQTSLLLCTAIGRRDRQVGRSDLGLPCIQKNAAHDEHRAAAEDACSHRGGTIAHCMRPYIHWLGSNWLGSNSPFGLNSKRGIDARQESKMASAIARFFKLLSAKRMTMATRRPPKANMQTTAQVPGQKP